MEPRVKERLIGAAILVGLVVVLVPEMLSGPHESEVGPPGAGAPLQTYTIDLTHPGAQPREPEPAPEQQPLSLDPEPAAREDAPGTAASSGSAEPPPAQTPQQPAPPPAQPRPQPQSTPAPKQPAPSAPAGDWAVQIGSFAKADNARRLTGELKAQGYAAYIVTTGSGASARHKVRVGPQASRAEADRMAARLKKEGRPVAVVSNK